MIWLYYLTKIRKSMVHDREGLPYGGVLDEQG